MMIDFIEDSLKKPEDVPGDRLADRKQNERRHDHRENRY